MIVTIYGFSPYPLSSPNRGYVRLRKLGSRFSTPYFQDHSKNGGPLVPIFQMIVFEKGWLLFCEEGDARVTFITHKTTHAAASPVGST